MSIEIEAVIPVKLELEEASMRGPQGNGIENIEFKRMDDDGNNVYVITMTDNTTYEFTANKGDRGEKGETGNGISSIAFKETTDVGDNIYTVTTIDGSTYEFTASKGAKGDPFTYEDLTTAQVEEIAECASRFVEAPIFIATYGTTPAADILEAYNAGKLVVAQNSSGAIALLSRPMTYGDRCYFSFINYTKRTFEQWACIGTEWGTASQSWAFGTSLSTVTLPASGWGESDDGYEQTVSASAVATSGYVYTVYPNSEQYKAWCEAGIYAEDVTERGKLTFICSTVPTVDIVVNIKREKV